MLDNVYLLVGIICFPLCYLRVYLLSNTVVFFGKNNDFSDGGDLGQNAVQLKPQRIKIKLIPSK